MWHAEKPLYSVLWTCPAKNKYYDGFIRFWLPNVNLRFDLILTCAKTASRSALNGTKNDNARRLLWISSHKKLSVYFRAVGLRALELCVVSNTAVLSMAAFDQLSLCYTIWAKHTKTTTKKPNDLAAKRRTFERTTCWNLVDNLCGKFFTDFNKNGVSHLLRANLIRIIFDVLQNRFCFFVVQFVFDFFFVAL